MRIIGGKLRSRKFDAPTGDATRPTADRAKVALFNILCGIIVDAQVLDGFAGSGALSFEALSRGAAGAVLFETDVVAAALLRENAKSLGLSSQVDIRYGDFMTGAAGLSGRSFDIVFLDPPYKSALLEKAIVLADAVLAPSGIIVAEHSSEVNLPETAGALMKTETRRYGAVAFSFYKRR